LSQVNRTHRLEHVFAELSWRTTNIRTEHTGEPNGGFNKQQQQQQQQNNKASLSLPGTIKVVPSFGNEIKVVKNAIKDKNTDKSRFEHTEQLMIVITSGQRLLTKGRIAILSPLRQRMDSSDLA